MEEWKSECVCECASEGHPYERALLINQATLGSWGHQFVKGLVSEQSGGFRESKQFEGIKKQLPDGSMRSSSGGYLLPNFALI